MLEHPAQRCRACDGALTLTLPAHGVALCANTTRHTCGNSTPEPMPAHKHPALCWQCVQCKCAVCACGDEACGAASFRSLRHEDLARAGLGKNQCTGMPQGLGAGEFADRVLHACLEESLCSASPKQVLTAFVCAYPDSMCLLVGAHAPRNAKTPCARRTASRAYGAPPASALCLPVDMEAALHYAAKTCGLAVKIDAIRNVVDMMHPDGGSGTITHGSFRKFVRRETAFLASTFRWRLVRCLLAGVLAAGACLLAGLLACWRRVCVCCGTRQRSDTCFCVCAAHEHAHGRAVA